MTDQQKVISSLNANWVWVADWIDSSISNTAGRIVRFTRSVTLNDSPSSARLHFSADTRYKLFVNGRRVAVGPTRGSLSIWYFDTIDISPYLRHGQNEITFAVLRYFAANRAAMPFERTSFPGLTVVGNIKTASETIALDTTTSGWTASTDYSVEFPIGLIDDGFLHISERTAHGQSSAASTSIKPYNFKTLNGDLLPWRLRAREIPMPEEHRANVSTVRLCHSGLESDAWAAYLTGIKPLLLSKCSKHTLDIQADVHSTAFLKFAFRAATSTHVTLKLTYSEGYELEPRSYPFFRSKDDRLDAQNGHIIGPFDLVHMAIPEHTAIVYEPFWFRTFRLIRLEIETGVADVELVSFEATQVNYPLAVKATWDNAQDLTEKQIWDVSIRTMRNCMFDGYSDCPFYEQLQYSMDSRAVGLFHYLLAGDDRLMRQAITNFASSVTAEGLTQSRFPSHVNQLIAAFPLYWILEVCDHHLYFGDTKFARSFLPRIDGILEFFDTYIDERGLVSGLPDDVWQFVDWVTTWHATDEHPDKGVPTAGRKSNCHTYFSMIFAYVLREAASLLVDVGRPGHANEYLQRAQSLCEAVRQYCYDGEFFTDSTSDINDSLAYSQHCQVFAVLSGAAEPNERVRLLQKSFATDSTFSKCSYMMQFYALRAFSLAGDQLYESFWPHVLDPWRTMLTKGLTTWEEDDVRQRSDCHAWGSVPIYEYCTEIAGLRPTAQGASRILFKPRLTLSAKLNATVALGKHNTGTVSWKRSSDGKQTLVELRLSKPVEVISQLPGHDPVSHGLTNSISLSHDSIA